MLAYGSRPDKCPSSCPELTSLMMSLLCVDPVKRANGELVRMGTFGVQVLCMSAQTDALCWLDQWFRDH